MSKPDFWIKKWQKNEIRFHEEGAQPDLIRYGARFQPGKVIVPLCGKTLDLLWFRDQGHEVIGIELSPIACEAFFIENKLSFEKQVKGEFTYYQSGKITLLCGDFFKTPDEIWKSATGLYDRAALIALPHEMRQRYTKLISEKLPSHASILLLSIEYPVTLEHEEQYGPPFSVVEREIKKLYEKRAEIEVLTSALTPRTDLFEGIEVKNTAYWLTIK